MNFGGDIKIQPIIIDHTCLWLQNLSQSRIFVRVLVIYIFYFLNNILRLPDPNHSPLVM